MDRRSALKAVACLATTAVVDGCASRSRRAATAAGRRLPVLPVPDIRPEREVRTVVGLRPFRPSGFVVRAEKVGDTVVVHNYGHGGGGIALSWGTGTMAARLAGGADRQRTAVLGCGAVGLATARLLQERGHQVTIYAKDLPPRTTSNASAGQCFPGAIADAGLATPAFTRQLAESMQLSLARFSGMAGARYAARWLPTYYMSHQPFDEDGLTGTRSPLGGSMPGFEVLPSGVHPFPFEHVRRFSSLVLDPGTYLSALLDEFRQAGGSLVVRELDDLTELTMAPERVVVNCTGLGARALFGDDELVPLKGQLVVFPPQGEIDYATLGEGLYMMPRQDGVVLGGTHQRGVSSLEPDAAEKERVLVQHAELFAAMRR